MEIEGNVMAAGRCSTVGFEDGGRGYKPRDARIAALRAGKTQENEFSHRAFVGMRLWLQTSETIWTFWPLEL